LEEQYLIYNLLSIASNILYVTYPIADLEGKTKRYSMVIPRLKVLFPNVLENTDILKDEVGEDGKVIVGKTPTFNNLIKKLHEYVERDEITDLWKEIYRYYYQEPEYREKLLKVISGFNL